VKEGVNAESQEWHNVLVQYETSPGIGGEKRMAGGVSLK